LTSNRADISIITGSLKIEEFDDPAVCDRGSKQRSERRDIGQTAGSDFVLYYVMLMHIHTYISLTLYPRRGSRGISDIPPRRPRFTKKYLAMRNTANVTGGKPVAI
jgi:hypothetical protein